MTSLLTGFSMTCMEGRAFSQCTACSATAVESYRRGGWEMVLRATKVSPACPTNPPPLPFTMVLQSSKPFVTVVGSVFRSCCVVAVGCV